MSGSLLQRAQAGDQQAFADLTAPHRRELHRHCYRLLGSITDADDLLQETLVAAWRGLPGFAGRSTLRVWLYRIGTNRCLNAIRDGKRRPPTVPVPPFEPPPPSRHDAVTWLQPYPDAWLDDPATAPPARVETRETVGLAFVAALQLLPPRQTAALVLGDVLGFPVADVADMLGVTPTAVKGLRQRARHALRQRGAAAEGRVAAGGHGAQAELVRRFADAFAADDVDAVVDLLTDDAWLRMPPAPHEYRGRPDIAAFLLASAAGRAGRRLTLRPTRANGQPAFTCFLPTSRGAALEPSGVVVLDVVGDAIAGVTRFLDPRLPELFDCPVGGAAGPLAPLQG